MKNIEQVWSAIRNEVVIVAAVGNFLRLLLCVVEFCSFKELPPLCLHQLSLMT